MSRIPNITAFLVVLAACGGEDRAPDAQGSDNRGARQRDDDTDADSAGAQTETSPLMAGNAGATATPNDMMNDDSPSDTPSNGSETFVTFVDADSGFATDDVHDADREVVHFDSALGAMVWSASGNAVSGWSTSGSDLRWSRSGVAFRVRFGSEAGERRAYFTETASGTICDLNITSPDSLSIRPTNEMPPQSSAP